MPRSYASRSSVRRGPAVGRGRVTGRGTADVTGATPAPAIPPVTVEPPAEPTPTPPTPPPATPDPVLSGSPTITNITTTSVRVNWTVSQYVTGWVEYGPTAGYGSETTRELSFTYSSHAQTVSGLTAGTTYHYRVTGANQNGQTYASSDGTFTTAGGSPITTGAYGTGWMNGVGNLQIHNWAGDPQMAGHGFRAAYSGDLTSIRVYMLSNNSNGSLSQYGGGDGGTVRCTVRTDNGGYPSSTVLATATDTNAPNVNDYDAGLVITFPSPATLVAGTIYHIHYENLSDTNNWTSVNHTVSESGGIYSPYQPAHADGDWFASRYNGGWSHDASWQPILQLNYSGGQVQGWSWYESIYGASTIIVSGSSMAREVFTVSGGDRRVTGIQFRMKRANAGTDPMYVRLEDWDGTSSGNGTLIEEITFASSAFTFNTEIDASSKTNDNYIKQAANFVTPHILISGNRYAVRWYTASGTEYRAHGNKKGSASYGYDASTCFGDGYGQKSANSGGSWSNIGGDHQFSLDVG